MYSTNTVNSSAVSKFNASPTIAHLTAAKRILMYLKKTEN